MRLIIKWVKMRWNEATDVIVDVPDGYVPVSMPPPWYVTFDGNIPTLLGEVLFPMVFAPASTMTPGHRAMSGDTFSVLVERVKGALEQAMVDGRADSGQGSARRWTGLEDHEMGNRRVNRPVGESPVDPCSLEDLDREMDHDR